MKFYVALGYGYSYSFGISKEDLEICTRIYDLYQESFRIQQDNTSGIDVLQHLKGCMKNLMPTFQLLLL